MASLEGKEVKLKLAEWAGKLEKLHPSSWAVFAKWTSSISYDNLLKKLEDKIAMTFDQGKVALQTCDYKVLQESIEILDLMDAKVGHRIKVAAIRATELKERTQTGFVSLCENAQELLESEGHIRFQGLFVDSEVLFSTSLTSWHLPKRRNPVDW
jgi:hypothetical protein